MKVRRVCVVTGSRADWGLLSPVIRGIEQAPELKLQLLVTGSHLEQRFGHTLDAILTDGFTPDVTVPLKLDDDSDADICRALGHAVTGIGAAMEELAPDLILLLGDRYEILGAAQAAFIQQIPVAHIAGGDISTGALDDSMRHAISKLSHLHFVTNQPAQQRLLQMGESAQRVFLTGSPGIDAIHNIAPTPRHELSDELGFEFRSRNIAVAFHPETLSPLAPQQQLELLVSALARLAPDLGIIVTGANADSGGQTLNTGLAEFCASHDNACMQSSLGQAAWYGLLHAVDAMVGNSSAGLYEAPSFGIPTVNIGDRQQGRLRAESILDCALDTDAIVDAVTHALDTDCSQVVNPYGDGHAAERILDVLVRPWPRDLLRKTFIDRTFS